METDIKHFKAIIQKVKLSSKNEDCLKLADNFEEFLDLYEKDTLGTGGANTKKKLEEAHVKFLESFAKTAATFGITPPMLLDAIQNPRTEQEWKNIGVFKNPNESQPKLGRPPIRKLRKNNKLRA